MLSKLRVFSSANVKLEQYPTDSEIAADALWNAYMRGDIKDKTIADLGCGTGILGIGALLLGAKKAYFVDKDNSALKLLEENLEKAKNDIKGEHEVIESDVSSFTEKTDVVIQNPPFGTRQEHIDKIFLETAFSAANIVYSFHKLSTKRFIEAISSDNNFKITALYEYDFPLKATQKFHKKRIHRIQVGCWRMEKQ